MLSFNDQEIGREKIRDACDEGECKTLKKKIFKRDQRWNEYHMISLAIDTGMVICHMVKQKFRIPQFHSFRNQKFYLMLVRLLFIC